MVPLSTISKCGYLFCLINNVRFTYGRVGCTGLAKTWRKNNQKILCGKLRWSGLSEDSINSRFRSRGRWWKWSRVATLTEQFFFNFCLHLWFKIIHFICKCKLFGQKNKIALFKNNKIHIQFNWIHILTLIKVYD